MRSLILVVALIAGATVQAQAQQEEHLARGRMLTRWVFRAHVDSLLPLLTPEFLAAAGGRQGFVNLTQALPGQIGTEMELLDEAVYVENGLVSYYRVATFSNVPQGSMTIRWLWQLSDGRIPGAQIAQTPVAAASEHLAYETKTPLTLPFDDEWYVFWGGDRPHQNYHVVAPDQRFAYDFLVMRDGRTFDGDGKRNESYFCFGRPVRAPGAGRVVASVDSVADNVPGEMNRAVPPGNHVVIDHGNGEFSLLAHFRRGTVRVQEGQDVKQGDHIGDCGNSGNSSEPHLHYHLQTGAAFRAGVGLPASFNEYIAGTRAAQRGRPVRGEQIRPNVPGPGGPS